MEARLLELIRRCSTNELSQYTPFDITAHSHQILRISQTTPLKPVFDPSSDSQTFFDACSKMLLSLSIHEELGFSPVHHPTAELVAIGSRSTSTFNTGWVALPHVSERSKLLISSLLHRELDDTTQRLLEGLSQSYASYFPRDALVSLWTAIEDDPSVSTKQDRLLTHNDVDSISDCIRTHCEFEPETLHTITLALSQLKRPTKNEVIIAQTAEILSKAPEDVSADLRPVIKARGIAAHHKGHSHDKIDAALPVLRTYAAEILAQLLAS